MTEQQIDHLFRAGIYSIYAHIGRQPSQDEMQEYLQESWSRWLATTDSRERASPWLCARRATSAAWMRERRHRLNIDLLWQGWNDEKIAQEMDIPYLSVREYRKLIKKHLTNYTACGILNNE